MTIDKAGRLVIPKPLRERVGLTPGEVEVFAEGSGLRVEPVARDDRTGLAGGAVYDALVGYTAKVHGIVLATRDGRAADTYRALGVAYELLG